uniref:Uncharacterized protein n=1 Tax=Oryza punctata TaxID=4537 RepID=A0A0E0K2J4_ORYPU
MEPEEEEEEPDMYSSEAGEENHVGGFYEYMGLPRDTDGFVAAVREGTQRVQFLAGVFRYLGEDMVDEVLRSDDDVHCPSIASSSPAELLACAAHAYTGRDQEQCGGSVMEHLYMLCACFCPHAAAAAHVSAVVAGADDRLPAPCEDGVGLTFTQDELTAAASTVVDAVDEVTEAAATVDVDEIVLSAVGFDEFVRDLKEIIEAKDREDALRAEGSSVSPGVRPPV